MTRRLTRPVLALCAAVAALLTAGPAAGDGLIVIHDPPPIPQPHPRHHHRFAPLEVREHHVTVAVREQVAVTEVNQTFYNPHHQQLEGTYLFPVPKGAQIDTFAIDINGEMVEAELLDADKARAIYTDIVRTMRDPALMEYVGQALFKVRIFPIEGRSEKRINLRYTELLEADSGMTGYRYPLNTEKFSSSPIRSLSVKVNLETASPIATLYCPTHEVDIIRHDDRHAVVCFEQSDGKPDHDFQFFYGLDTKADSGLGFSVLTHRPQTGEPGYFMLLASPSLHMAEQQVLPKDIVFVLDTSGSMAGAKLEQAQNALRFCLANLNAHDRFDIIRFSTETESLFGGLSDATDEHIRHARRFVDDFKARGGTDIAGSLAAALKGRSDRDDDERPYMVIFLTDGRPTVGTTDTRQIIDATKKLLGDELVRVFCFGIGTNINTRLLDTIAQATRSTTEYVLPDEDIEVKVSNFYTKVDSPVLAGPTLDVNGSVRLTMMQPRSLPDVFKGEQIVVFGRYDGSGDAALSIDGNLAGTKRTIVYEAMFPPHEADNAFIARLWATRRVGWLLDEIRLHGETDELKDEVTQLARDFGIVTPYTSYLILEDEAMPLAFRGAPDLDLDRAVTQGRQTYRRMRNVETGDAAVTASSEASRMKSGGGGYGGGAPPVPAAEASDLLGVVVADDARFAGSPVRYINGRAFYHNGSQWIDSTIRDDESMNRMTIKPYSDAYFELIDQHPEASAWLALGDRMQLRLGNTVYNITETAE